MPHTPGPWAQHHNFRSHVVPAVHSGRPVGGAADDRIDREEYAREICRVEYPDRHRSKEEVLANARLIAAAPDMLDALHRAVQTIRMWHGMGMVEEGEAVAWELYQESPEMKAINAAIAKAQS